MENNNQIKIFGHKVPDTDTVASAIAYAWYYNEIKKKPAQAYVLGELNKETAYVLDRFGVEVPPLLPELTADDQIVIVDTNNIDELPESVHDAELLEIIDHHKLFGGLKTAAPIDITLRVMASTASLIYTVANPELHKMPKEIAAVMLAAILSDTLEFRSPTTTDEDKAIAEELAKIAEVDIHDLANEMFKAKSDISDIEASDLIVMDSKIFNIKGKSLRVSVIETTAPDQVFARKDEIMSAIDQHVAENSDVDELLLFVVDILEEQTTPILSTNSAREIVGKAFGIEIGDKTILKGIVSRKKQIIPKLEA